MSRRAEALADRIERGAQALAAFAETLSDAEWHTRVPGDGRTVGTLVHHVASAYAVEMTLARTVASGRAIENVTWDDVAKMPGEARRRIPARPYGSTDGADQRVESTNAAMGPYSGVGFLRRKGIQRRSPANGHFSRAHIPAVGADAIEIGPRGQVTAPNL